MDAVQLVNTIPCVSICCSRLEERTPSEKRLLPHTSSALPSYCCWPSPLVSEPAVHRTTSGKSCGTNGSPWTKSYCYPPHCRYRIALGVDLLCKSFILRPIQILQAALLLRLPSSYALLLDSHQHVRTSFCIHTYSCDSALP